MMNEEMKNYILDKHNFILVVECCTLRDGRRQGKPNEGATTT